MGEVAELQIKLDKKKRELVHIQDRINTIKEKESLPELRKLYVGKCFRYTNSGGGKSWPLYWRIVDITDVWYVGDDYKTVRAECFRFELLPDEYHKGAKIFQISQKDDFPVEMLGTEITEAEFQRAWDQAMKKLSGMWMPKE